MDYLKDFGKSILEFFKTQTKLQIVEHSVVAALTLYLMKKVYSLGVKRALLSSALHLPLANKAIDSIIESEVEKSYKEIMEKKDTKEVEPLFELPLEGFDEETILKKLSKLQETDVDPSKGKAWAYVYALEDEKKHHQLIDKVNSMYVHSNALNPLAFNSLRRVENDICRMVAKMFCGDEKTRGVLTSGGTESILLAIKTYRDMALSKNPNISPEMILPSSAHAAFFKGGHYFGVKVVSVPIDKDMRADIEATKKLINKNTVLLVVSAPQYPHGVIDPIEEMATLGLNHGIPVHVDSCIGGFVLPFAKMLGVKLPGFDFTVKGVTSISADVHKYGYSSKGSSVVLFKSEEYRRHAYYAFAEYPSGLFVSPSLLGTRGGGPITCAWATMTSMGLKGYQEQTKKLLDTADFLKSEVNKITPLKIIGNPQSSLFSFKSEDPKVNIFSVADEMDSKGWKMECQRLPDSIHCTLFPKHVQTKEIFIKDLKASVEEILKNPEKHKQKGTTGMYGMASTIDHPDILDPFLIAFMGRLYQ